MKQKVMNHIKNNWQEYASFISMIVLIVLGLIYAFNLNNFDFNYPLAYYGGDDMGGLQDAKLFQSRAGCCQQTEWVLHIVQISMIFLHHCFITSDL